MLHGLSKIKNIFLISVIFFFGISQYVYAQISLETGVTISASVPSGSINNNPPPPQNSSAGSGNFLSVGPNPSATVNFSGQAYPLSKVIILKDYVRVASVVAGPDAKFAVSVTGLSAGNYNFSVYGEDDVGRKSTISAFPLTITSNVTVDISGVFISPTIQLDKTEVAQGDNITIFGQSLPHSNVVISVHSNKEIFQSVPTDKNGIYLYTLDTSPLELGTHTAKSKTVATSTISSYGAEVNFTVVSTSSLQMLHDETQQQTQIASNTTETFSIGDINKSGGVGITDYSIMAFWYNKPNPPAIVDLNHDGVVNLVDFSILAYYWTGN